MNIQSTYASLFAKLNILWKQLLEDGVFNLKLSILSYLIKARQCIPIPRIPQYLQQIRLLKLPRQQSSCAIRLTVTQGQVK